MPLLLCYTAMVTTALQPITMRLYLSFKRLSVTHWPFNPSRIVCVCRQKIIYVYKHKPEEVHVSLQGYQPFEICGCFLFPLGLRTSPPKLNRRSTAAELGRGVLYLMNTSTHACLCYLGKRTQLSGVLFFAHCHIGETSPSSPRLP